MEDEMLLGVNTYTTAAYYKEPGRVPCRTLTKSGGISAVRVSPFPSDPVQCNSVSLLYVVSSVFAHHRADEERTTVRSS